MQNIDFYEKRNTRVMPPQFTEFDPEYFPRVAQATPRETERIRKRASRIFFIIAALCIISFTTGIVVGIKFAGGTRHEIVDTKTFNAVADIGKKIPFVGATGKAEQAPQEKVFPRESYPYVLGVNGDYDIAMAREMAGFLSQRGHTVILSKNNGRFRIYVGPFRKNADAREALKKISGYSKYSLAENTRIIKR